MHIGLIGGIGPAATLVYYDALSRQCAQAGERLHLTIANADTREMIANMEAGRPDLQAVIFARYIDQLRAGGCEAAAITSMGGHFCIEQLKPLSSLPIISTVPALDACLAARGYGTVGVMGTRAVMNSGIYGVQAARVIVPEGDDLEAVHANYLGIAVAAAATPEQIAFFHAQGRKLIDRGADVVILGGTDLSVAFADNPGYPILDSALVHAEVIGRVAMDKASVADFA
ncbi:aspartate/glutamate racemase family protein [Sphingobium nicotianae]|uniref:Aspartate/glutamate racemase family protein n=1 Tax=Sphingobium nicotianae TaxID=2782607 RepID=A0A9X1DBD0_9SPHN|nr:aspartate/glutamate racemase family protein [Sphingobium nicotianae]MBT2186663.1 aspartate/glutamate racemase family protein [Sphingobium nicotianae]